MRNTIPGRCYRCGGHVREGEGVPELVNASHTDKWATDKPLPKWLLQHSTCCVRWRGTTQHYLFNDTRQQAVQKLPRKIEKGPANVK